MNIAEQTLSSLRAAHHKKQKLIECRLLELKSTWEKGDRGIFRELCFCIFAANTSARMGMDTVRELGNAVFNDDAAELSLKLKGIYRFWRVRALYVAHTRTHLNEICGLKLRDYILSFPSVFDARNHFAEDKNMRGIGFKEASHFFRNIGFFEFAILDKHILKSLKEYKVIGMNQKITGKKNYLAVEKKLKKFSEQVNIPMSALDLLLWSGKTGEILK